MSTPIPVICYHCGSVGGVQHVTAALRCGCGSDDLDYYTGSVEQKALADRQRLSRLEHGHPSRPVSFAEYMTGKTAAPTATPVGGDVPGWNEYTGPRPTPSGESNGVGTPMTCPTCHGSGFDIQDGGRCRTCGGSGTFTPNTTAEPPAVARHDYPSNQTTVPYMGRKRTALMDTADAPCPSCSRPTTIVADAARHAWWHCAGCGPLHDLDVNPHLNPYRPPASFTANARGFATKKAAGRADGKLVPLIAVIGEHNPGLTAREILTLGRQTLTYARTAETA